LYFSGDTLIVALETHEKYRAIADVLSSSDYKILREFLMENLDVRQDIPGAEAYRVDLDTVSMEVIHIPFARKDGDDGFITYTVSLRRDEEVIGTFAISVCYGEPPAELTPFYTWIDPCAYAQQNGGCNATSFNLAGWEVDSTGKVVPVDVADIDPDSIVGFAGLDCADMGWSGEFETWEKVLCTIGSVLAGGLCGRYGGQWGPVIGGICGLAYAFVCFALACIA